MQYYRVYAKFAGQKQFKPVDLSTGRLVTNLIHATMVSEERIYDLKEYLNEVQQDQPEIEFKLEKIK